MKRFRSVTNLSLENNLLTFRLNAPVAIRVKVMMTGAFSQNISKLFFKLKLVALFIYVNIFEVGFADSYRRHILLHVM